MANDSSIESCDKYLILAKHLSTDELMDAICGINNGSFRYKRYIDLGLNPSTDIQRNELIIAFGDELEQRGTLNSLRHVREAKRQQLLQTGLPSKLDQLQSLLEQRLEETFEIIRGEG